MGPELTDLPTDPTEETPETNGCPSCAGSLVSNDIETFCPSCGLVTDASPVVVVPVWLSKGERAGNGYGSDQIAPPTSTFYGADSGTVIGHGGGTTHWDRFQMHRLRRLDGKVHGPVRGTSRVRQTARVVGFAKRLGDGLSVPPNLLERAFVLYRSLPARTVGADGKSHYRSSEERFTVCLIAASREQGILLSLNTVRKVSGVSRRALWRTMRLHRRDLPHSSTFLAPERYLRRFATSLNWSREARDAALSTLSDFERSSPRHKGSPAGIATGAMSLVAQEHPNWNLTTCAMLSRVSGVSEPTIRTHRSEIARSKTAKC